MQTLPNGVKIRDFYSPRKVREDIFRRVQEEFTKKFPMENDSVRIELDSIGYDEKKKSHSLEDYQNAVLTGGRLATPLRAKVRLIDKKFNVPLEEKDVVLANVPYMTDDGTFVIGGNHYITNNQARLKSGVYARAKDNGELESHINVKSGTGPSMRVFMEPENGVFRASIDKSNIKLYPILNALGVPDEKLREVWGDEILKKNQEAWDRGAFSKFYGKLLRNKAVADASDDEKKLQILDRLSKAELDPEVTTRTLGRPHSNLSLDTIVDASHKLLKVNRGEEEEDDRDHPANRTYHSVDDFMAERVSKDAGMLAKNLLYRTTYDRSLKQLRPGYFTPQLEGLVVGNQLTQLVAGLNPMELYDQHKRVIQLGEGGVGSMESIPMSCYSDDTEVFTKDGWVLWSQVTPQTLFACRIDGRLEFHLPHRVVSYAYSGQMYGISTVFDLLVTPNHRHWIQKYRGGSSLKRCGAAGWEFEFASNTHRKPRNFAISHEPFLGNSESKKFEIGPHSFDLGDFAEFIGWYVSEGHWDAYALSKKKGYRVVISQSSSANPEKVKKIRELLVRMRVRFSYSGDNFVVNSRHLFEWVGENCGIGSANKRLPEIVFSWPYEARCRISEAMVLGDGHEYISGHEVYHTTSPLLMGHLVQLWILNGVAASPRKLYFRPDAKPQHAQPYSCSALTDTVRGVTSEQRYDDCYSIHSYSGMVYCAEVPGGLLLVRRNDSYPVWSGNSRNLHAGELGMVDPIRSSESRSIGVDQRFTMSAMKGDDNHVYYPLKNKKTGQIEYLNAVQLAGKSVAFPQAHSLQRFFTPPPVPTITPTVAPPAPMTPPAVEPVTPDTSGHIKAADLLDLICPMPKAADLLSTPGVPASPATPPAPPIMPTAPGAPVVPRKKTFLSAVKNGKIDQFPDDEVDYELASPNHQFTETSVMVPLTSTIKGARTFIASKYATQALPLVNPDSPLVDVLDDDTDDGYTKTLGRKLGLKNSDFDGVVKKVSERHIDLTDLDGKTQRIELKKYFPSNRKTYTSETPTVAVGDRIAKGQPVARNNYVDNDGRLAIGKNLTVAFMPAPGGATFEDAIVVSESAAKKMTSPHLYGFDVEHKHGVESGKDKFISLFPNKYTNEQLAKLDANGMVKPGVRIEPGDPILLSYSPRSLSSKDAALGNLSKVLKNSYRDLSQTWDKSSPGVVAHAVSHRSGLGVHIATNMPLQEGDKICMTPDHEVLTTDGWIPIDQVQIGDYVYSLDPETGKIRIEAVAQLFCFQVENEQMYNLETTQVSMCVTNNHKLVASPRNFQQFGLADRQYGLIKASDLSGKRYRLKRDGEFCAPDLMKIIIDPVQINLGGNGVGKGMGWSRGFEFAGDVYAWLVGAYIAEGNLVHDTSSGSYGIELTQVKPKGVEVLKKKLDELGVKWGHRAGSNKFVILGKALYEHFLQFGCRSWKKMIPRGIFDMFSKRQFRILLDGLMWGDGNVAGNGSWHYHTSSPQLADDVQQLVLLAGYSATVDHQKIGIDFDPNGGVIDGRQIVAKRDRYILSILKHKNSPEINHGRAKEQGGQFERWVNYTGQVYCIEVPQNHTFYVRRNGKPHWTGNSARSGAKGVVSKIVPDAQMVRSKDSGPVDVIINPAALIGRVNPGMVFEALLGKVAAKHGKTYNLPSFSQESYRDYVENELKAHGESDGEDLEDPETGKSIPQVLTGRQFFMKLEHTSESKLSGRGEGGSDINEQPTKGGERGCFIAGQKIRTATGQADIGRICEKRLGLQAFTYSQKLNEWVFRPITDWFVCRARVSDILTIHLEESPRDWLAVANSRAKVNSCIYPTKNHWIYKFSGEKVQAGALRCGDELVSWGVLPTADQEAFLYGTLLGDSSVSSDTFLCKHSVKQQAYLEWKQKILASLGAVRGDTKSNHHPSSAVVKLGYASSSEPLKAGIVWFQDDTICSKLRVECYSGPGQKKKITASWLSKLNGLSVAAWILDDGCITNSAKKAGKVKLKGSIATHGFSRDEAEMARSWLEHRYGAAFWLSRESSPAPIIHLSVEACRALIAEIAKWVPASVIPASKKFLIKQVRKIQEHVPRSPISLVSRMTRVPLRVKSIEPYRHDKPGIDEVNVYDFTVEDTHSYCAGPVLVSNSKRLGGLQNYALLSHGADHVLEDAHVYRGSANPEMWRRWRLGESLPPPKAPFIYEKFLNSLKAAGVNPRPDEKGRLKLLAMTDRDVDELARYEVQVPETISHKDGSPVKGGLMDFSLHGGPEGKGWSYIKLEEPMPSPVMEEPIRRLLGITEKQMRGIIAGTDTINGRRGPQALYDALKGIKLDELINSDRETIRLGKKTKRDEAVRRVNFATGLKKSGIEPHEMMITKVPVIPPAYRPVVVMGDMHLTSDANYLYKDLMSSRDVFRSNKAELSDEDLGDERLAIYDSIRAIQGMGDPINVETANKGVKGFIRQVAGVGGPKCYDDETEILTENGWVPFPRYTNASVKVATLNPQTQVMEFQNPSDILHEPYFGTMVHTKTSKLDILVTEGHWHYVEQCVKRGSFGRGRGKRTREWQSAKKIQAGELAGKTQRHRYVVSADNFVGETPEYSFEGYIPDKDAFSQFVGWWVAEGFLTFYKYKTKNLPRAAIIAVKDGTSDVARIDDMFARLGIPFKRRTVVEKKGYKMKPVGYKTVLWRVSNYALSAWLLKNCGSGAENKKISPEILGWEKEHQHLLLGAYLDGDGEQRTTKEGKGKTYFNMSEVVDRRSRSSTTSLELVNNIERICLQTGLGFRLTDEFFEDHKTWKKQYRFRIYGYNRVVVEYKEQTEKIENWSGMVHCVTVPNGLIFVRRNGRHVVSGNTGMFVSKVIGHPVNTVGRSVIVPNADLDMDQVGIPEKMAWEMFEPHVMRSMVREGMPAVEAARRVEKHDDFAKKHMLKEMEKRKVMYSRDPALHRFSIMGANAVLVPGNNIHLSPLVVKPFGADFDGDQMNIHVPITERAVKDVEERMMPSKNLFNLRGNKVQYLPSQEFILGLYGATQPRKGAEPMVFKTTAEAISAYKSGAISIDQPVIVQD